MPGSNPGLVYGQVPTAAQWNDYFAGKQDYSAAAVTGPGVATAGNLVVWGTYPAVLDGGAVPTLIAGTGITISAGPAYTISASGGSGTVTSVAVSGGTTGLTTSGGPITGAGTITLAGTLAVANGGTGSTTQNFVDLTTTQASIAGVKTFTGQLIGKGTATNDSAAAGQIGEYISSSIAVGAAVPLTPSATSINITSISLTAGDWDVSGNILVTNSGGTFTDGQFWIGQTSATLPTLPNGGGYASFPNSTVSSIPLGVGMKMRISLASTTTVYLSANIVFVSGTYTGYGFIGARRAR